MFFCIIFQWCTFHRCRLCLLCDRLCFIIYFQFWKYERCAAVLASASCNKSNLEVFSNFIVCHLSYFCPGCTICTVESGNVISLFLQFVVNFRFIYIRFFMTFIWLSVFFCHQMNLWRSIPMFSFNRHIIVIIFIKDQTCLIVIVRCLTIYFDCCSYILQILAKLSNYNVMWILCIPQSTILYGNFHLSFFRNGKVLCIFIDHCKVARKLISRLCDCQKFMGFDSIDRSCGNFYQTCFFCCQHSLIIDCCQIRLCTCIRSQHLPRNLLIYAFFTQCFCGKC